MAGSPGIGGGGRNEAAPGGSVGLSDAAPLLKYRGTICRVGGPLFGSGPLPGSVCQVLQCRAHW